MHLNVFEFIALRQLRMNQGRVCRPIRLLHQARRSGRSPALPYPPAWHDNYIVERNTDP
jgi:hypothetical protein